MDTHFTVVFERPEWYEDVHPQLCAEDHIIGYANSRWEAFDGNLAQQCEELAEALEAFSEYVHAEECSTDGPVTYSSGHITSLAYKARDALAKYRQPQEEAPELFPGTLDALRDLGKKEG